MTLLLTDEEVRSVANMRALIPAIESGFREEAAGRLVQSPRMNLETSGAFFRLMGLMLPGEGLMGFKVFGGEVPAGVSYLTGVFEIRGGRLLALMNGAYLTAARTGAVAGIAAKYLARPDATAVAVIGAGLEAQTNLEAMCTVRRVTRVTVYSPRAERRARFAREAAERYGVDSAACGSPREAVAEADIVVVATNTGRSPDPIAFRGEWMRRGMHVSSIGSTMPWLREIDSAVFAAADLAVVDAREQAAQESGDVIAAVAEGACDLRQVVELSQVVAGARPDAEPELRRTTLFKSVGTAMQDVCAAHTVYREAMRLGTGRALGELLAPRG